MFYLTDYVYARFYIVLVERKKIFGGIMKLANK